MELKYRIVNERVAKAPPESVGNCRTVIGQFKYKFVVRKIKYE